MRSARLLITSVILFFSIPSLAQSISNEGTDFWAVFPSHVPTSTTNGGPLLYANIVVFITSKANTEVKVTCGAFDSGLINIPANTAVPIPVSRASAYIDISDANEQLLNRGIHIKVTDGKPKVAAYAHIYAGNRSAASLILPVEALGQKYFSANYTQNILGQQQGYNYLTLVGVMPNTKLIIRKKDGTEEPPIELNTGDVYEYTSGLDDLTGVSVYVDPTSSNAGCTKFAAFSGSSNMIISDCSQGNSADPLYQQIYPVSSLGKTYGIVPFIGQSYQYRAIATEPGTKIYQDGVLVGTLLNAGDFYSSGKLNDATFVTADKKILVSQYMYSVGCASNTGGAAAYGDVDMVLLNPIEFNVNNITVFSSVKENIFDKYLNIIIKTNRTSTFKINGNIPSATWNTLPGNPLYSFAQIPVSDESLTLSADAGFNAIAYGYGSYESYAYSAGTNLAANNFLTVINNNNYEEGPDGCIGVPSKFKITLPYEPTSISWSLDLATPISHKVLIESIPQPDGTSIYVYGSPFPVSTYTVDRHTIDVIAPYPATASCITMDPNIHYVFNIYNLPVAGFTTDVSSICTNKDVKFNSAADPNGIIVSKWLWDFGDGTSPLATEDDPNPTHQYATEGNYSVKLLVKSVNGCLSDPSPVQTLQIHPLPQNDFTMSTSGCKNTAISITDNSSISTAVFPASKIVEWIWDFGDGATPETRTDNLPFTHAFTEVGMYQVTLTTKSNEDCESTSSPQSIYIKDLPIANFKLPDVCADDPFAKFENTSNDASDGSGSLTYLWDFGDPNATAANPNTSVAVDGIHKYLAAGTYPVKLTVTNINGCQYTESKFFTVNERIDQAAFTVQNESNLCGNNDVIIKSGFTVLNGVGRIVKLEIYQDYLNNPTVSKTVMYPTNIDEIRLTYPSFGGNSNRDFTIKVVGYTGGSACTKEALLKVITLKPSPQLEFDPVLPVCDADGTVLINQAKQKAGEEIDGSGRYSGKGISEDGTFNPKVAGVGSHEITYTYNANNGCSAPVRRTIEVYKSPVTDVVQTLYILSGGQLVIPATAEGTNLKYEWSPGLGLDKTDVLNPLASPDVDTEYTLTVTSQPDGCTATSTVLVKVLQALNPPNTFTPNGDNVNDVWQVKYLDSYPNATVEVFNRNGNRVFFSNGYSNPFDGNYQNQPLPVGVYYYLISPRNGRKTISGPLTIIR